MTTDTVLRFTDTEAIGSVIGVDTARVTVMVTNPPIVQRLSIGNLVAIKGNTETEHLIGLVERVTRGILEQQAEALPDDVDVPNVITPGDVVRVTLIGTFRAIDGSRRNVFKRGADLFPQIDRLCHVIDAGNLQRFMGLLGADLKEQEKLKLGTFVADRTAAAIASGDRLFQRHAAILGSTGSGKSWTVALMLERASQLRYPNIIVFDLHGEYRPLVDRQHGGYATGYKIAGPGDLEQHGSEVIFLPFWALNRDELLSMLLDRSDTNAPNQASRFTSHVRDLKEQTVLAANAAAAKTFTVDSPIPFSLADLLKLLHTDDTEKGVGSKGGPVKGEWEGKLTRFISRTRGEGWRSPVRVHVQTTDGCS